MREKKHKSAISTMGSLHDVLVARDKVLRQLGISYLDEISFKIDMMFMKEVAALAKMFLDEYNDGNFREVHGG